MSQRAQKPISAQIYCCDFGAKVVSRALVALVACVCLLQPAIGQSVSPNQKQLTDRVVTRVEALTAAIDASAGRRAALADDILTSSGRRAASVLQDASRSDPSIPTGEIAQKNFTETKKAIPLTSGQKNRTVKRLQSESLLLSSYANQLRNLSADIKSSSQSKIISKLEQVSMPPAIEAIIFQPGPQSSSKGGSAASPAIPSAVKQDLVPFIVGIGDGSVDYPAVAEILYRNSQSDLMAACTGTLIAPNAVITAAHCLAIAGAGADRQMHYPVGVFFQHAGLHVVDPNNQPIAYPKYNHVYFGDIGVIFLRDPVWEIAPISVNNIARLHAGASPYIVGFGYHSIIGSDAGMPAGAGGIISKTGIKVWSSVTTTPCPSGGSTICWAYQSTPAKNALGSTCYGDSGGPLIIQTQDGWTLAGITIGSTKVASACSPGDQDIDVEVFDFAGWIKSAVNSHPVKRPASTAAIQVLNAVNNNPENRYAVAVTDSLLLPADPTFSKQFSLEPNVSLVRVAVNATPRDIGVNVPLHLTVARNGIPADCDRIVDDSALSCDLPKAPGGDWTVTLSGAPDQEFQMVATLFPASP